jgi:hypothetical protein
MCISGTLLAASRGADCTKGQLRASGRKMKVVQPAPAFGLAFFDSGGNE